MCLYMLMAGTVDGRRTSGEWLNYASHLAAYLNFVQDRFLFLGHLK